ncbi:MAG: peptidylprolyl isomerase [Pyrinomonadaceae bacterium]
MKQLFFIACAVFFCLTQFVSAQIPTATLVKIVKAEDERRFDATLENLLKNPDFKIRTRAALASGRIGDERAVSALVNLLKDNSIKAQTAAMFALGEIESAKASGAILDFLKTPVDGEVRARALEAAGKIAAANPKDANTPELGRAIVSALNSELNRNNAPDYETILLGETAVLRVRPDGGESVMIKLLSQPNARLRADALNTLARLRSKNVNDEARELLAKDSDSIVRANAARLLGIGEDKTAIDLLLNAATKDSDSRVRVSAIRSLGNLKDAKTADALLKRAENLLANYKKSKFAEPVEKNELLEIAMALGRILANSNDEKTFALLSDFDKADNYVSPEIETALARVSPEKFLQLQREKPTELIVDWRAFSATAQGIGELANLENNEKNSKLKNQAVNSLENVLKNLLSPKPESASAYPPLAKAVPDVLRAYAQFKTTDLPQILRESLENKDVFIRAAAAEILGAQPAAKENVEALKKAFDAAFLTDKNYNDAQLAILDALFKLDKKEAVPTLIIATNSKDYLVRKKAFDYLKDESFKDSDLVKSALDKFIAQKKNQVLPHSDGSKLGQILNTNADYVRAVSRKNGSVKAILTTTKGNFTIEFFPEDAPLTVDNFIRLARANYFNGLEVHRVVPNFVVQDGDPRGDGNGGPGWEIRDEINMIPYNRGAVGMALSGKDTGGSQWFVTHSPQPHLDGGYTVFGRVNEMDMKIVDIIARGDKILSVKIVEANSPKITRQKPAR